MLPIEGVFKGIMMILLLFVQLNLRQFVFFRLMSERWAHNCLTVLTAAMIRGRNWYQGRISPSPYAWPVPHLVESWFDLHHHDVKVPGYFLQQLWVTRNSFNCILNLVWHCLARQPSNLRDPLPPEKILASGLYRLGHGNLYVSIGPSFNGIPCCCHKNLENLEIVRDYNNWHFYSWWKTAN